MKKFSTICCVMWLSILLPITFANDITVSSVSLENQNVSDHYCIVEFNLNWDNSWRTSSVPQNWDAAWIFIKYSVAGGEWFHATLNASNVSAPSGSTIDFGGTAGAFIYRDSDGSGINNWFNVGLRWDYGTDGVADDAQVEIRVFAIEMVFVPAGNFYLGDGAASSRFYEYDDGVNTSNTYLIDGSTITLGATAGNLDAISAVGTGMNGLTVPTSFPTGHDAYYCMKYEVSQEQYVDFLNTLTRDQQNTRTNSDVSGDAPPDYIVMSGATSVQHRNGISCPLSGNGTTDPITFFCDFSDNQVPNQSNDGQNIACNYLRWMDLAAYADWAGLRPMTDMEFEKACRGPNNPVANEMAWGTASVYAGAAYNITNEGYANEGIDNLATGNGNALYTTTYPLIGGPVRCGLFAAGSSNNTRVETGAGYYGIMELSGNVSEMIVNTMNQAGLSYTGLHGDGLLTATGDANTDYWPGINGMNNMNLPMNTYLGTFGVTNVAGAGMRGGYYDQVSSELQTSNRIRSTNQGDILNFTDVVGGRLVRTAP